MKGYLYQIKEKDFPDSNFGIYWSSEKIEDYMFLETMNNWESSEFYEEMEFEEFWNFQPNTIKIIRVFLEEVFI